MAIAALIVAAGRGTRADAAGPLPKQYAMLGGRPVLAHVLARFAADPAITAIQTVIHPDDRALYDQASAGVCGPLLPPVAGGASRQASVLAGLEALARHNTPSKVLIHDAARPFVGSDCVGRVITALDHHTSAISAIAIADTLKRTGAGGIVESTVDRAGLWQAQTPQGFGFQEILDAHRKADAKGLHSFTDDAAIAEWAGLEVALVMGSADNFKITTPEDMARAERMMAALPSETRVGSGFDVHRFTPGNHVWLCGVRIAHTHALEGHSDADVALHALTDALLGAIGDGDIGQHFPPSDPKWKGAASRLFVEDAVRRVAARGGRIVNVDITILAEEPKIGPHRAEMQAAVASLLAISPDRIGIKATTTEQLGFTGRREGIVAMATASVTLPA